MRRHVASLLAGLLCGVILLAGANSRAYRAPATTLDEQLLAVDAALVASVSQLAPAQDDPLSVDVTLVDTVVVFSRWAEAPGRLRVMGRLTERDGLPATTAGLEDVLVAEHRYLLLLRGGQWTHAPLLGGVPAVFEVDTLGVHCDTGYVYGLGHMGFHCAQPDDVMGSPLTETGLVDRLRTARDTAVRRRPELAAERDAAAAPLQLIRTPLRARSTGGSPRMAPQRRSGS